MHRQRRKLRVWLWHHAAHRPGPFCQGIEVLTGGNHSWDRREIMEYMPHEPRLLRPANFPNGAPGSGRTWDVPRMASNTRSSTCRAAPSWRRSTILSARLIASSPKCPRNVKVRIVDMHAEATSEKVAMGWHLDGKVSAVIGTHTHVATADSRVLPRERPTSPTWA